jgi:hypothetical protein
MDEGSDQQIAAEAGRWAGAMQLAPRHISKCGDSLLRGYLYEAAAVLIYRDGRASILKSWSLGLAKRASPTPAALRAFSAAALALRCQRLSARV